MSTLVRTGSQKAAAVLLAVGPERAAKVMSHLSEDEVEQVTVEIATLGDIPGEELKQILFEFRAEALAHEELLHGSQQHALELLRRLRGLEADDILERIMASTNAAPFGFLRMHEPDEVLQHLRDEHPQTVALVLAHLPARLGAHLLSGLKPAVQVDVATRLATLERADPDVVARIEEALRERLGEVRRRSDRPDGVKELADLLNQSDRSTERSILSELEAVDPALAERIRSLMFLFEDLIMLDDRSLQELLRNVEMQRLAVALKGTSDEVRGTIRRNLSHRARTTLDEEIELLGQVRISEVEEAQAEIVRKVRELEAEGVIVIKRGEEEYVA